MTTVIETPLKTCSAEAFVDLYQFCQDGFTPRFEDCELWDKLSSNTKVAPVGETKNGLTYGYTRGKVKGVSLLARN